MTKTLAAIRSELMDEFGLSESNSNSGTAANRVMEYMNKANERFINNRTWTFNLAFFSYAAPADSVLAADFTTAALTCVLAQTDDYGTTGKVNVNNDIISFTANNTGTDTLTITTAEIDRDHTSGEKVTFLKQLPADYAKPAELRINGELYLPDDVRNEFAIKSRMFWQHHFVSTVGLYRVWLQLPYNTAGRTIFLKYSKAPVDFTAQDPTTYYIDIPNPFFTDFLKYDVMSRMNYHIEEIKMAQVYEAKAEIQLKKAAAYDAKQHAGTRMPIRTKWDNPKELLYGRGHTIIL